MRNTPTALFWYKTRGGLRLGAFTVAASASAAAAADAD